MRVTVYDKNPGPGLAQWFLKTSWLVGCWLQKLFGQVDDVYGAESWADALNWLARKDVTYTSIQYWGHGSTGVVWLAGKPLHVDSFAVLKPRVSQDTVVWFRTCSTFQGVRGHTFSWSLSDLLGCVIAGHTRVIGLLQGGLHTRRADGPPSWPVEEGEFPRTKVPAWLKWGNNTVTCFATKIPKGW